MKRLLSVGRRMGGSLREGVNGMVAERQTQKRAKAIERATKNIRDAERAERHADADYWRKRLEKLTNPNPAASSEVAP